MAVRPLWNAMFVFPGFCGRNPTLGQSFQIGRSIRLLLESARAIRRRPPEMASCRAMAPEIATKLRRDPRPRSAPRGEPAPLAVADFWPTG